MTRRVQNLILIALALLFLSFHLRLKQQADPHVINEAAREASTPKEWKGKVAPDFEVTRADGSKFALADHVGKEVVILNFFATWCAPCRVETPELDRFARTLKGRPALLVGIDSGEKPEIVAAFVKQTSISYPVFIDEAKVSKLYGVKSLPTTVVIGADGRIALYELGGISNADVAFGSEVGVGIAAISQGHGIQRDAWLAAARGETYYGIRDAGRDETIVLTGRAKLLSEKMPCVCGCKDTVAKCGCSVAKAMMKKLREAQLDGTNDVAVMQQVNAEFCMKEMK
jgi:thiol-disulfide isomerase/thioredoxin